MKIRKFDEAKLNLQELDKPSKEPGKTRGDVLIQKVKDGEDLTFSPPNTAPVRMSVANPEEVTVAISDDEEKYDSEKSKSFFMSGARYKPVIKGSDDLDYKLNDIEKTADFGSSGGRSLGTQETRNVECLQCLFFSLRQELDRTITEADIIDLYDEKGNISKRFTEYIRVPVDIDRAMAAYAEDKLWTNTFVTVANAMWESSPIYTRDKRIFERSLDKKRKYRFFQIGYNGTLTQAIVNKYRQLDRAGIPIAKWTPTDVWAVSVDREAEILSEISTSRNFRELNRIVNNEFSTNDLRGISLKKVSDVKDITIIINRITPVPTYKFKGCVISANPYSNKGSKISATRHSNLNTNEIGFPSESVEHVDVRSFSGPTVTSDISGEIIGETARHGKIGLTRINRIIDLTNQRYGTDIKRIPTKDDILPDITFLKREIEQMQEWLKEYGADHTRMGSDRVSTVPSLISKYQSMSLCFRLYEWSEYEIEEGRTVSDHIIEDMFHYAMAIRNEEFVCPKYIRMI
jgi:hypothetical protein